MYDGPIREGSRGGRDQFSWESVKGDKDREFYLGHSVKALVGHWQKHKDPYWYAKNKGAADSKLADEVKAVKQKEEELMLEALGIKKARKKDTTDFGKKLQKFEVDELLKRREREDNEQQEMEDLGSRALGFRRTAAPLPTVETHDVLEGVGLSDPPPSRQVSLSSTGVGEDRGQRHRKEYHKREKKKKKESELKKIKKRDMGSDGKRKLFKNKTEYSPNRHKRRD